MTFAYDPNGNRTSADGPEGEITSTYDPLNRLNRPLTVTAEDASATRYTYDPGAPTRVDPSGIYDFTLDAFGANSRPPTRCMPPFSTSYRADGQPASRSDPTGNLTDLSYDPVGHLTASATTAAGGSPSAPLTWRALMGRMQPRHSHSELPYRQIPDASQTVPRALGTSRRTR